MARILVIDDDIPLSQMLRDWMTAQDKHEVVIANDGTAGLRILTEEEFHLAIIDWDLPGMPGPAVVSQFRATGGATPILMLTGRATDDDKEKGFDSGADDYLTKPFSVKELGARMRSLLRRGAPTASSIGATPTGGLSSVRVCPSCGKHYNRDEATEICVIDGSTTIPVSDREVIGLVLNGTFQVESLVGVGAWSEVYKARNLKTGESVAVKIMHNHLTADRLKVERFRREAEAISKVRDDALANIIDQGSLPSGRPLLIMDFVDGVSLDKYLAENGRLTLAQMKQVLIPVCRALGKAHAAGLIHRDLKPSNITLTKQNGLYTGKLLDFGLAKIIMHDSGAMASLTASGEVVGTPAYMSPEQCLGGTIDNRSDLYSLGCILYEVLTGRRAIEGKSSFEAMSNHIGKYPNPIWQVCKQANIPPKVEDMIFKLMAKEPDERFSTAEEFVNNFQAAVK